MTNSEIITKSLVNAILIFGVIMAVILILVVL